MDRAIHAYHGDNLELVLVGAEDWEAFCEEAGLTPSPVFEGHDDVEVVYDGISVRPSARMASRS